MCKYNFLKRMMLVVSMVLLMSACGQQSDGSPSDPSVLTLTDFSNRTVSFSKVPEKVVALSSGDVDLMQALGVAVVGKPTVASDHSIQTIAEEAQEVGTTHEVNYEQIALLKPDVVLANTLFNQEDVPSIEGLGTKVILTEANSVEDIMEQITLYGEMLQKEDEAKTVINDVREEIKQVESSLKNKNKRVMVVYGAPGTYMAALPNSLSGDIVAKAGAINIASDYPALEKFPQYAQINTERVVESNPDLILLITHGNAEEIKKGFLKEMQQNAAWNNLEAVKAGRVEILPSTLFGSNPGTKVTDAIKYVVDLLNKME